MWFDKKDPEELYPPKDEYQRKYRQAFDGVVDKYLIYHCEDENAKILIYIDLDNDIDWIMKKDPLDGNEELNQERNKWLANLDIAQASPCLNLSEKNIMKFKIMLGAGYESALYGNFDSVQSCIDQALLFLKARNKEQSRYIILSVSTTIVYSHELLAAAKRKKEEFETLQQHNCNSYYATIDEIHAEAAGMVVNKTHNRQHPEIYLNSRSSARFPFVVVPHWQLQLED
ncbi:hypothetical protein [Segatella copri]